MYILTLRVILIFKMEYKLLIDKRERDVLKHEAEFTDIYYETKQMEIADYIIMNGDKIEFAIERKSWSDFASSIKDGRHNNKSKMMALRTQTNCKVFYIVEGAMITDPNRLIGRMPYRIIESAMFHMQVRDNIYIIRTMNTLDTAKSLVRFIRSLSTIKDAPKHDHEQGLIEGAGVDGIPLALTQRVAKSDIDIVRELWSGFRSITASSADYLIEQFSVGDFIRKNVKDISTIKFSNGRNINKPMVRSLTNITREVEIRLLSKIPMISTDTAKELLRTMRLENLLSHGEVGIAMRNVKKSKLGVAKAKNIIKYFNYKKGYDAAINDNKDIVATPKTANNIKTNNIKTNNTNNTMTTNNTKPKPAATPKKPVIKNNKPKPKPTPTPTYEYKDDGTTGFDDDL